mmetsp:Transcript_6956/g.13522  ORF Transcript_6956/g.13522 Transcript_6956/m.13522 type:complete len:298 (+) Transcript_6956:60-953(+)
MRPFFLVVFCLSLNCALPFSHLPVRRPIGCKRGTTSLAFADDENIVSSLFGMISRALNVVPVYEPDVSVTSISSDISSGSDSDISSDIISKKEDKSSSPNLPSTFVHNRPFIHPQIRYKYLKKHTKLQAHAEDAELQKHLQWISKRYQTLHADDDAPQTSDELAHALISRTADALYVLGHAGSVAEAMGGRGDDGGGALASDGPSAPRGAAQAPTQSDADDVLAPNATPNAPPSSSSSSSLPSPLPSRPLWRRAGRPVLMALSCASLAGLGPLAAALAGAAVTMPSIRRHASIMRGE